MSLVLVAPGAQGVCVPLGSKRVKLPNQPRLQQFGELETHLKEPNLVSGLRETATS